MRDQCSKCAANRSSIATSLRSFMSVKTRIWSSFAGIVAARFVVSVTAMSFKPSTSSICPTRASIEEGSRCSSNRSVTAMATSARSSCSRREGSSALSCAPAYMARKRRR